MKRVLAALGLVLVAACNQQTTRPPARLSGTHVVAVANELAFIASTDRHELLVIDGIRLDFVRAPNPLELLSIPVIDTPTDIARDLVFNASGFTSSQATGRYVYAWSRGGRAVSAVGAGHDSLREEYRTSDLGMPITAVAARGATAPDGGSTLLLAMYGSCGEAFGPNQACIYRAEIPAAPGAGAKVTPVGPQGRQLLEGVAITSMAVLPDDLGDGRHVVVAVRRTAGGRDDVLLMDLSGAFAPISLLDDKRCVTADDPDALCGFSHPVREVKVDARDLSRIRVWGVLDESTCSDGTCSGIEVVEVRYETSNLDRPSSVERARDATGFPMRRLEPTGGIITSLDLTVAGPVCPPGEGCRKTVAFPTFPTDIGYLGLTTQGNGDILILEGDELRRIDADTEGPTVSISQRRAQGNAPPLPAQPEVALADGAARDEIIEITYGGRYAGGSFPYKIDPSLAAQVLPGDQLVLLPTPNRSCDSAVRTFTVDSAGVITASAAAPDGCDFELRAGTTTARPWVVLGSQTGLVGRLAEGGRLEYPAASGDPTRALADLLTRLDRYQHHSGAIQRVETSTGALDVQRSIVPPQITLTLPALALPAGQSLSAGDAYIVDVDPHLRLLNAKPPVNSVSYTNYFVPAAVARSETTNRTYVVYPSAAGGPSILGMDLSVYQNGSFKIEQPYQ